MWRKISGPKEEYEVFTVSNDSCYLSKYALSVSNTLVALPSQKTTLLFLQSIFPKSHNTFILHSTTADELEYAPIFYIHLIRTSVFQLNTRVLGLLTISDPQIQSYI